MKFHNIFLKLFLVTLLLSSHGYSQLTGDKIIKAVGGDYATLADAFTAINTSGVTGTVRLLIDENLNETGANLILSRADLTAANNVLIKPNAGKTPVVTISGCATTAGASQYSGMTLDGADFVTIDGSNIINGTTRDLTIALNDNTNGRACIKIYGDANNISIKNVKLVAQSILAHTGTTYTSGIYFLAGTTAGTVADNGTVENNEIGNSTASFDYALWVNNAATPGYSSGMMFYKNIVWANIRGANLLRSNADASTLTFSGNTVSLIGAPAGYTHAGLYLENFYSTLNITKNRFISVKMQNNTTTAYTMYVIHTQTGNGTPTVNINNNFIGDITLAGSNTANNVHGISANATNTVHNIFYNTIYMNSENLNANTGRISTIRGTSSTGLQINVKNNLLLNTNNTATSYGFDCGTVLPQSNNNLIYVPGSNAFTAFYNSTGYQTLENWKAAGQDSLSIAKAVTFVSLSDLHLSGPSLGDYDLAGVPVAEITTDIDEQTRSSSFPYKGADEDINHPIPVELVSFSVKAGSKSVLLEWATATEVQNFYFEIERRAENGNWSMIGRVRGNGTTLSYSYYSFEDANVGAGKYYYRLKQIDYNGTFKYNDAIFVEVGLLPETIVLLPNYPNPFNPSTTIEFYIPEPSMVNLSVYNSIGERVSTVSNQYYKAGTHKLQFDGTNLSCGVYLSVLSVNGKNFSQKMVLNK